MNSQSNADSPHSQDVLLSIQGKTTEELLTIWQESDKSNWSKEYFDTVQKVLMERIGKLSLENNNKQITSSRQKISNDGISGKYPYLTAFIGFIALYMLFDLVLGFILLVSIPVLLQFKSIIDIFVGFYIFKFVVEKNVLPYVQKK